MDNVVQNINIEDIIPSNFQPSLEERKKIEELAQLVKSFGLIDPILVRPKDGKYEIILGVEKYQAATIARLKQVPVIVKEIDDEVFKKYSSIEKGQALPLEISPTENFSKKEKNSDIINLSELNKRELEYERDDFKMNNEQFNNNMMNNLNQPNTTPNNQNPTFGGKFFPSLEDEPTNMNMMGNISQPTITNELNQPTNNVGLNNNLIDLTDLSVEKEPTPNMPINNYENPTVNIPTPTMESFNNVEPQTPNIEVSMPTPETPVMATNDTIINLDNLQNNNPSVKPITEPVSMDILNSDFGAPTPTPTIAPNDFNMNTNSNLNIPQSEYNPIPNLNSGNLEINPPTIDPQSVTNLNQNVSSPINTDFNSSISNTASSNLTVPQKDITPVVSTIKDLAANLEKFGYKIIINEEDLPTSTKITIEVEK